MDWIWFFLTVLVVCITTVFVSAILAPLPGKKESTMKTGYVPPSMSLLLPDYHDDQTIQKVRAAIQEVMWKATPENPASAEDFIYEISNAGILFRERR